MDWAVSCAPILYMYLLERCDSRGILNWRERDVRPRPNEPYGLELA